MQIWAKIMISTFQCWALIFFIEFAIGIRIIAMRTVFRVQDFPCAPVSYKEHSITRTIRILTYKHHLRDHSRETSQKPHIVHRSWFGQQRPYRKHYESYPVENLSCVFVVLQSRQSKPELRVLNKPNNTSLPESSCGWKIIAWLKNRLEVISNSGCESMNVHDEKQCEQ